MENEKRKKRRVPENSYDSVLEQMNILLKQLESIRLKALADYNEIKDLLKGGADNSDRLQLETIRANCLKTIESYFKMRIQVLNIQVTVVKNANKKIGSEDGADELLSDKEKDEMAEMAEKLRESMRRR